MGHASAWLAGATSAVAVNAAGQSEPSEWSAAVAAPAIPPGNPTGVSARPGDRSDQLVFAPPDYTGGLPIVAYEYSTDDGATWRRPDRDVTAKAITIGGLVNGTTHLMRVRAVTVGGVGQPSTPMTVTPRALPSAPRAVSATPKDAFARVMWQRADGDGGSPITSYRVTARPGGATCETGYLACDVVGLTNGVAYTFLCRQ